MSFFDLVRREMEGSLKRLVIVSSLGGISTASILAAINAGAQTADRGGVSLWAAMLFVIALLLFIQTQHYILITTTAEIEAIIHKLRVRLMDYVRRSELLPLEAIGRAEIVAAITRDTATLTQAGNTFAFAAQGGLLIFCVAMYVAYLSPLAFVLSIVIVGVGATLFHAKTRQLSSQMREAAMWENRLFDRLTDLLDGFKEVRLNKARSDELYEHIVEVSRAAANIKIRTQSETYKRMVLLQSSLYTLLGTVAFVVPVFSETAVGNTTKTITALVFIVAACFGLVQSIPIVNAANTAADRIKRLEDRLQETVSGAPAEAGEPHKRFNRIEMRNVGFRYVDKFSEAVFKVGPIDFTLQSGDMVFITGGNGSGKSTFMKLLAGLYKPDSGEIIFDGTRVTDSTYESYRSLIAAIFPDFHLFQRLYGIPDPDPAELERLLAEMRLLDKTRLTDGEFRTVDLSSGQRKRLALIVSLLEKRPILLLDEWAADQDPEFRRKFYFELLPALNRAGVTVVAITHDDRYIDELDLPARRLPMDEGRFLGHHAVENQR
jgi:putative pyoverdin transport system ATP-binding/permease protein